MEKININYSDILTKIANKHSYNDWFELVYDCNSSDYLDWITYVAMRYYSYLNFIKSKYGI